MLITHTEKAHIRLVHIDSHLDGDSFQPERILRLINRIAAGESSAAQCISQLKSYVMAKGMSAWFHTEDLSALKNWFYVRNKLEFILGSPPYNQTGGSLAYENQALFGMFYLVSDHPGLINWYSNFDSGFNKKRTENTAAAGFWTQQFFIALRGEWDVLIERCERILASPPSRSRERKFMPDHCFYLALAKGDIGGMEAVIKELVTPKLIARREPIEGGYTADLICTPAILYSKLAWRHGYQVEVDSPYIPKAWLPISSLDSYEDPFDFMKQYSI
ncbi:Imm49 family immunity protein [Undibacterium sp. Ji50W]|uniref:Imm49 family immunity protein n=1 Tax=Undibacterium sp. Ji50W TaxID=3413041 RepID=UPI003BF0C304